MKKVLIPILILLFGCSTNRLQLAKHTVMITNLAVTSGGSGSVIDHNATESKILTNAHVCDVVEKGGYVITDDNTRHPVLNYVKSQIHDLCVIEVAEDLETSVGLASNIPNRFDSVTISGHPHLYPTTISQGHFGSKQYIKVLMGLRDCTVEDVVNPDTGLFCMLVEKLPMTRKCEAIFITAPIMPGSSGSGVFDDSGHLAAVVFSGSSDFGYGYAVPLEYVYKFLREEIKTLHKETPSNTNTAPTTSKSEAEIKQGYNTVCADVKHKLTPAQKSICHEAESYFKYRDRR